MRLSNLDKDNLYRMILSVADETAHPAHVRAITARIYTAHGSPAGENIPVEFLFGNVTGAPVTITFTAAAGTIVSSEFQAAAGGPPAAGGHYRIIMATPVTTGTVVLNAAETAGALTVNLIVRCGNAVVRTTTSWSA